MSVNVFGTPITTRVLEAMDEFKGKEIKPIDRANVALDRKTYENKFEDVKKYVRGLKESFGNGVSTLCLIYNATGGPITFVHQQNWDGSIYGTPNPPVIANGQWGGFLHIKPPVVPTGSFGATVYHGTNNDGLRCDWMTAWANPFSGSNKAYTEIGGEGHYDDSSIWDSIYTNLEKSELTHVATWNGCESTATMEQESSPFYEATFTLLEV